MTAPAPTPAEAAVIDRFGIFDEERQAATAVDVDALAKLREAATPGPWDVSVESDGVWLSAPDEAWPGEIYGERRQEDAAVAGSHDAGARNAHRAIAARICAALAAVDPS